MQERLPSPLFLLNLQFHISLNFDLCYSKLFDILSVLARTLSAEPEPRLTPPPPPPQKNPAVPTPSLPRRPIGHQMPCHMRRNRILSPPFPLHPSPHLPFTESPSQKQLAFATGIRPYRLPSTFACSATFSTQRRAIRHTYSDYRTAPRSSPRPIPPPSPSDPVMTPLFKRLACTFYQLPPDPSFFTIQTVFCHLPVQPLGQNTAPSCPSFRDPYSPEHSTYL